MYSKMSREQTLREPDEESELIKVFTNCPSLYSVYIEGSYYTKNFNFGHSDIDLSLIVEKPSFEDIHTLEEDIKLISKKRGVKISTCYSEINDLKKDVERFKAHAHGKKRTSFLYDILNSQRVYGKDLKADLEGYIVQYHPFELYSNMSELITNLYNSLSSYHKCINISFIIAKTTLLLKGIYSSQKEDIINSFSKNIDAQFGHRLLTIFSKSKKELQISKEEKSADLQFIMDFCHFCKDYSRELVKVNQNELKPIPKAKK